MKVPFVLSDKNKRIRRKIMHRLTRGYNNLEFFGMRKPQDKAFISKAITEVLAEEQDAT